MILLIAIGIFAIATVANPTDHLGDNVFASLFLAACVYVVFF